MKSNVFLIPKKLTACADPRMDNGTVRRLWRGFTFGTCELALDGGDNCRFVVGAPRIPERPADAEYVIAADENGLAVTARDYPSLMRGYAALLMKIEAVTPAGQLGIAAVCETSRYTLKNRMIHFCIFPETDIALLRRHLRLTAVLGYTHAVLEFWGTLAFDCCPALAWKDISYTKDETRDLLREMRELGIQPIPMFNHLGHASLSRICSGKHVVLDQDPSKYAWFTPDGWSWNTFNPNARALLTSVRAELYELFGEVEYFHAGLDESYNYARSADLFDTLPEYLGELTHAIAAEGRRPMIWMDMFLPPEAFADGKKHICANHSPEKCSAVLKALHPSTVLVDWQYGVSKAPVTTSLYLKNSGFDIMGAPWLGGDNGQAHLDTAVEHGLFGVMQTTWHTLATEAHKMIRFARHFGAASAPWSPNADTTSETATLLRKLPFEPLSYEQTGWMARQICVGAEKTV